MIYKLSLFLIVLALPSVMNVSGQTSISKNKNNPYSPSPVGNIESRSLKPTEIYKVGVGDVLFVNLKYSDNGSRHCTVQPDGSIDFPLAGDDLVVVDQTVDEIEQLLEARVILFPDPQVEVNVRKYASHKITLSGLVENPGQKSLQREAVPLFVIRAEAVVKPSATKVTIKRTHLSEIEIYDLLNPDTDDILIYSGNLVKFTGDVIATQK